MNILQAIGLANARIIMDNNMQNIFEVAITDLGDLFTQAALKRGMGLRDNLSYLIALL